MPGMAQVGEPLLPHASRDEWARQMRLRFSPKGMCDADGAIQQDFFKPTGASLCLDEPERWGPAQEEALLKVCAGEVSMHRLSLPLGGQGVGGKLSQARLRRATRPSHQLHHRGWRSLAWGAGARR